ncbi:hypothetical protein C9374_009516 [Naegleria lovaniensis]|uniref:Uncharacterized protein n=1 Tax=Naegleria lovaniensis TaxID=51637 RepID=A0AA88GYJ7_NAELO|nr:uncharacterized protein C9374_009516 [Naegleria lovaniensis]KAG2392939.1 hypothetical protein C9374_009516 [Naegleria lovaniensis]
MVRTRRKEYADSKEDDDKTSRSTSHKRGKKYTEYDSTEEEDFFEDCYDMIDSETEILSEEEEKKRKQAKVRVPKKKIKKSTEERLKQVVGEDNSQNMKEGEAAVDQEDDDNDESGGSSSFNTKRLLDARSKKAKRMDWEQGFFYLPKFDCYLPRHLLHSILGYLPAFPYYLTIRLTSQQWLDDFENVMFQELKELDLVQRNESPEATIKYRYPWYNPQVSTRMNNDCIRFLGVLFPNIEKLILPSVDEKLRVPQKLLASFPKLETVQIFYLPPFHTWRTCYRQDIINVQHLENAYFQNFAKIYMVKSENSTLVSIPSHTTSEEIMNILKYFVETERFSLDKTRIITSLHPTHFSTSLIDYILQVNEKQQNAGYEPITFTEDDIRPSFSSIFVGLLDPIMDYMLETQFFKKLTATGSIIRPSVVNTILGSIISVKIAKLLFEQAEWPFVFDDAQNPLLFIINNARNTIVASELISFFCKLKPQLISLGDENGIIGNNKASLNILNVYLSMNKALKADDLIIEALHSNGADITAVCPSTGNNLLHTCPFSEYLSQHLPKEYFLAKNNRNFNPLERLLKRIEVDNDIPEEKVEQAIRAFCNAYKKFNISLNDLVFENEMSLLHKIITLHKPFAIPELVSAGLDANKIDHQGKTPLHLIIEMCSDEGSRFFTACEKLIEVMDVALINKEDKSGKTALCYLLERYTPLPVGNSFFTFNVADTQDSHLKVIALLLAKGADLNRSIQAMDGDGFVKDNFELNRGLVLASWLFSAPLVAPDTLGKVLKYLDNLNELLVSPIDLQGVNISPLCVMLSAWTHNNPKVSNMQQVFQGDYPVLDKELLKKSIVTVNGKQVDPVLYVLFSRPFNANNLWRAIEALMFVPVQANTGMWWIHQECNEADLCNSLLRYQYEDDEFGTMNILHIVCKTENKVLLENLLNMLKRHNLPQLSTLLVSKTSKGHDVLDIISQCGCYTSGISLMNYAESLSTQMNWSKQNLRTAFCNYKYKLCFLILCEHDELVDEFSLDELMEICIGYTIESDEYQKDFQVSVIDMLEHIFKHTKQDKNSKLNILTKPLTITRIKPAKNLYEKFSTRRALGTALNQAMSTCARISQSVETETVRRELSWLELSYWKGLNYLVIYILHNDTSYRKKKQILTNCNLDQSKIIEWLTRKINPKGASILHLLCEDPPCGRSVYSMNSIKHELLEDVLKFLSKTDQFDEVVNIQDDNGESPLFYAIRNQNGWEQLLRLSDLKLKNKDGKTVDQCHDVTFCAHYFESSSDDEEQKMKDEEEEKKVVATKKKQTGTTKTKRQTKKK